MDRKNNNIDELNNDEATTFRMDGGRKGAYRDSSGELHIVDTTCTMLVARSIGTVVRSHGIAHATVHGFLIPVKCWKDQPRNLYKNMITPCSIA